MSDPLSPARRRHLLSLTPLGNWVAGFSGWDESKVTRDHGRFAPGSGAPAPDSGYDDPQRDFGDAAERPDQEVLPSDLPPAFRARAKSWVAGLSTTEQDAVDDYVRDGYRHINRALRAADGDTETVGRDDSKLGGMFLDVGTATRGLLSAAAKLPPHDPPVTCWRVMSLTTARMAAFVAAAGAAAQTGGTFQMPVFGSATLNPDYARTASRAAGSDLSIGPDPGAAVGAPVGSPHAKQTVLLEIRSRTGMPLGAGGVGAAGFENEVLQSPLSAYRVRGWKDVSFGSDRRRVLQLDELPG